MRDNITVRIIQKSRHVTSSSGDVIVDIMQIQDVIVSLLVKGNKIDIKSEKYCILDAGQNTDTKEIYIDVEKVDYYDDLD